MLPNAWSVVVVVSQTQESMNLQFLLQGLMWKQSYLQMLESRGSVRVQALDGQFLISILGHPKVSC